MQQPATPPGRSPHRPKPHSPHERRQQAATPSRRTPRMPVEQLGSPRAAWLGVAVGVLVGEGMPAPLITHGATLRVHGFASSRILLMQHSVTPPGKLAHIIPPHWPHLFVQQTALFGLVAMIPFTQVGSFVAGAGVTVTVGVMVTPGAVSTQGGPWMAQELLSLMILGIQQSVVPPGKVAHIIPPHWPQVLGQQTRVPKRTPTKPRLQLGSGLFGGGRTGGVGGGDEGGATTETMQGGRDRLQETPALIIAGLQHSAAPPGRRPQPEPPQVPQRREQQTIAPLRRPMIPVVQKGSTGLGIGREVLVGVGVGGLDGGGVDGGITQGAETLLQSRPDALILVTQQLAPWPSMLQSGPPHTAQVARQQAFPRRFPEVQVEISSSSGSNAWMLEKATAETMIKKVRNLAILFVSEMCFQRETKSLWL